MPENRERGDAYRETFARIGGLRSLKNEYSATEEVRSMAKKTPKQNSGMEIPDYQIEALVRCILPKIQQYYESEEGKKDLADYRAGKAGQAEAGKDGK